MNMFHEHILAAHKQVVRAGLVDEGHHPLCKQRGSQIAHFVECVAMLCFRQSGQQLDLTGNMLLWQMLVD